jgi:hypothetical protein
MRIVAMVMIVSYHFALHILWGDYIGQDQLSINYYVVNFVATFGQVGIGLFFIITGYFLYQPAEPFKYGYKRIFVVLRPLYFWILLFWLVGYIIRHFGLFQDNSTLYQNWYKTTLAQIFPFFNQYWYVAAYIVVLFLSPYLKVLFDNLDKRQLLMFGGGLIAVNNISILYGIIYDQDQHNNYIPAFSWLGYVLIGYYFNRFRPKIQTIILLAPIALLVLFPFVSLFLRHKFGFPISYEILMNTGNIIAVSTSIVIFYLFMKLDFKNALVSFIGTTTFGIYLIHENIIIRDIYWPMFTNYVSKFQHSYSFIILIPIITAIVFISCVCLESARKLITQGAILLFKRVRRRNE